VRGVAGHVTNAALIDDGANLTPSSAEQSGHGRERVLPKLLELVRAWQANHLQAVWRAPDPA
jgi:hypothetical protein